MKIRFDQVVLNAIFVFMVGSSSAMAKITPYGAFCKSSLILGVPSSVVKAFFKTEKIKMTSLQVDGDYQTVLKLQDVPINDGVFVVGKMESFASNLDETNPEDTCAVYLIESKKNLFSVLRVGKLATDAKEIISEFVKKEEKKSQSLESKKRVYKVIAAFLKKAATYVPGGTDGIYWDSGPAQTLEASYMLQVGRLKNNFSLRDFEDIVPTSKCETDDLITDFFGDNHGGITLELVRQPDGSIVFREWGPERTDETGWGIVMRSENYLKGTPGLNSKPFAPKADYVNCW